MRTRLLRTTALLGAVFVFGTVGYRFLEDAGWWDSFYMTAITVTTVGYREVFPLSREGQVFTVALLLAGLGILFFVLTEAARWLFEGELRGLFERARRSRMIDRLSGHEIVCGCGRMGYTVVLELRREGRTLVAVDRDSETIHRLRETGILVLEGDGTTEAVLRAAGVERARGLVACLDDDAHNVYTVLTARSLAPRLFIVARAADEGAEDRLRRAGADRVVNPYRLGGARLAQLLVGPS